MIDNTKVPESGQEALSSEAPKFTTYEDYVSYCINNNVTSYFTIEQWNDMMAGKLKFNMPGTLGGFVPSVGNTVVNNIPQFINAAQTSGIKGVTNLAATILKAEGVNAASDFVMGLGKGIPKNTNVGGDNSNGRNKPSGVLPTGGTTGNPNNLLGSYDVDPISLDIKPGLLNRTYTNSLNFPVDRACYSHLTGFKVSIPGSTAVRYFFDNVIIPWLKNAAQQAVNFRVDMSLLDSGKMINYLNAIIDAYSLVFFMTGIIAYTSVATNRDRATFALRSMISASDIDYLNQLKALLTVMPAPPSLVNLCFWLYQTFTDGDNAQIIYRFMPVSFDPPTDTTYWSVSGFTGTNSTVIKDRIAALNTADNLAISSLLTRIVPSWLNSNIKDPAPVALFSKSWMTLFANANAKQFYSTTNYELSTITSASSELRYFSFDSTLDGLILGLSSIGVGSDLPSLVQRPNLGNMVATSCVLSGTTYLTSRYSYVYSNAAANYLWRPSNFTIEAAYGRIDSNLFYQNTGIFRNPVNSFFVRGVTAELMETAAMDVLSYMMSIPSIKKSNSGFKSKSKSKSKGGSKPNDKTDSDSKSE